MTPTTPGLHQDSLATPAGPMQFALHIPDSLDEPVPLIIALHYASPGGSTPAGYGEGYLTSLVEPALSELGAIIAAPDCPVSTWPTPEAEAAVLALLDHLMESYPIHKKRVVLTGYAQGAQGVWYIATRNAARFSAAVPVSGSPEMRSPGPILGQTAFYVIHSNRDELMPLGPNGRVIDELRDSGRRAGLLVVEGLTHFELPRFVPHLKTAVGWLRRVWEIDDSSEASE